MNIKNIILDKYDIDIDCINLPKEYKIKSADISPDELEKKIAECRTRWKKMLKMPKEDMVSRGKAHLEKADFYEEILRNKQYLSALIAYYEGGSADEAACKFAKDFFTTIRNVNKSINQKEYNFFMQYFSEERKNEKLILEMLKKDFKTIGLKPSAASFNDEDTVVKDGQEGDANSVVVQVRFHRDTLSKLHQCEMQYAKIQKSEFLLSKYPQLNRSFYEFLALEKASYSGFYTYIERAGQEVYNQRQNDLSKSSEYLPLIEYYNLWKDELLNRNDVRNNFYAFKKLVQFPLFTPYLYLADDVSLEFVKTLLNQAYNKYDFENLTDFLYQYLKIMVDGNHFGFSVDKKLKHELDKIEPDYGGQNQASRQANAKKKRRKEIGLILQIMRFLATWPIYLAQFAFEGVRFAINHVQKMSWLVGTMLTLWFAHLVADKSLFAIILESAEIFEEFVSDKIYEIAGTYLYNGLSVAFASISTIGGFALLYVFVPVLCTLLLKSLAKKLYKELDIEGIRKTFNNIQARIEQKLIYYKRKQGMRIYVKMIWPIIATLLGAILAATVIALVVAVICAGLSKLGLM